MSWRTIVISNRAKLDLKLNYMVVRGENTVKIYLGEIGTLVIESTQVSLTAALLAELTERKIKVIFCDAKRNPSAELIGYYGAHDTSGKVRQQVKWLEATKGDLWQALVRAKIKNQASVLEYYGKEGAALLYSYVDQVEPKDATNREAHAAKVYFNSLFGKDFTRADDTFINAALNYGYTILLSLCNREIVANGYITQLGVFHDNIFNNFNLGSDIMEPLRIFVDLAVCELVYTEERYQLGQEEKYMILDFLNQEVQIGGKNHILNHAVKQYCKSIFNALNNNDISDIGWCTMVKKK